jgi:thymidylate synthase (FAD)
MKIVNQEAVYMPHNKDLYEFIEDVARTCYKSESKGDAKGFVMRLNKSGHRAMLEHEYIYLMIDDIAHQNLIHQCNPSELKYLNITQNYISGSVRAFLEFLEPYEDFEFMSRRGVIVLRIYQVLAEEYPDLFNKPGLLNAKWNTWNGVVEIATREEIKQSIKAQGLILEDYYISQLIPHTFKFIANRGVSHELVRHRIASFAQESQRYVGYDKEKFGGEIQVIKPPFETSMQEMLWKDAMEHAENAYMALRAANVAPQIARSVLPNSCKTEIIVTATEQEWQHIVDLRYHGTTGAPHPEIKELIGLAYPILVDKTEGRIK